MRINSIRIKRFNVNDALLYGIIIVIILDSASMYSLIEGTPIFGRGFWWLLCILCLAYTLQAKSLRVDKGMLLRASVTTLFLLLHALFTQYNVIEYLKSFIAVYIALFAFSYSLFQNNQMIRFVRFFSNIMVVIAVTSLFFWFFGSVLGVLPGETVHTYYWAEHYRTTYTYYYMYFENPIQNLSHGTICNLGIFAEAPGYSGFLTYALIFEIVRRGELRDKKTVMINLARIIILIITLVTTNSAKGILAVLLSISVNYISKKSTDELQMVLRAIIALAIIVGAVYAGLNIVGNKIETSSGIVRIDDLRASFITFTSRPLCGVGYGNNRAIWDNQLVVRDNGGISMGATVLLAYGGLWLFSFYSVAVARSYLYPFFVRHRSKWIFVVFIILYNLFVSNCAFSDVYIFLLATCYSFPAEKKDGEFLG